MSENASAELLAAAKDAAARNLDYYALLGIDPSTDTITRDTVQRAWRKRSLKYHPDKAGEKFDKEKWEEFGLARDILASEEARAAYDGARAAALQRAREKEQMNARQRQFVEELEEAEGRSKRQREEGAARREEEERERALKTAEGRRIVEERQRLVREAEEREQQRKIKDDEAMDDRIRELQDKLAEKARRKEEKRARREGRKAGVADEEKRTDSAPLAPHVAEPKHATESQTASIPRRDVQKSDDPVKFWATQWPKTRERLKAAQIVKEQRMKEASTAA
ncbi:hypothetical protein J7T55_007420 [Diaporthe amygdali]|uniref:uncharacterized protein n=1 Tax=Phomopsis amygdali TaxID=1214568 RepID=UPI0022FED6BB|nr:uncharacterized protein J7T55_007420 [Diaporthe amygdali]KAJ0116440.1 hypothetical protein J7T55_007420 [Diaporthe amygdali]